MQQGEKRELLFKEEGQDYGQVTRMLGNGRVECNCMDGQKRQCSIRGKLRNRVWINPGDLLLISLRDIGEVADVIHKFYPEEGYELQELGEIADTWTINEGMPDEEGDGAGDDGDIGNLLNMDNKDGDDSDGKNDDLDIDNL